MCISGFLSSNTGTSPHFSLHMRWCISLADNRRVFCLWTLLVKSQPRQCVSQHLVRCRSHWIWHIVLWWQQWAFCHLLSSANSMSNYTPATNLITVAEEIGWFNSFQLGPIGAVRSNFTHLRYELPATFHVISSRISGSWYDNWTCMVEFSEKKKEKRKKKRSHGFKCLLISDSSVTNVRIKHSTFSAGSQPVAT